MSFWLILILLWFASEAFDIDTPLWLLVVMSLGLSFIETETDVKIAPITTQVEQRVGEEKPLHRAVTLPAGGDTTSTHSKVE